MCQKAHDPEPPVVPEVPEGSRPVWSGETGDVIGYTHESLGEQLELGDHTYYRYDDAGNAHETHYTTTEDNW